MTLELCVMFVFNFKSLHSLLLRDPFTSLKVKKAINSNNNKKKESCPLSPFHSHSGH